MGNLTRLLRYRLNTFLLQVCRQQMVEPGRRHKCRQKKLGPVIRAPVSERDRGDQHDSVQVYLMALLQDARELCRTRCAIALADQEFRRCPAHITCEML